MAAEGFKLGLVLILTGCTTVAANQATFDNTQWQVVSIDGRATPPNGNYSLRFDDGRVAGRFGCNSFGGNYSVTGRALLISDVATTLMGCPEPAASFESKGLAILSNSMGIQWQSGQRIMLRSARGVLELELIPPAS